MTQQNRALGIWILGFALAGLSGCASRGFVRNEVETSATTLSAGIDENRVQIEETQEGLNALRTSANETHERQDQQLSETQEAVEATRSDVAETQEAAQNATMLANAANEQGQDLARLFDDRSRFEVRASHEILFGFDSAEIGEEHRQELDAIAAMVMSDPNTILVLEGRTDSLGDPEYNRRLGERRVEAAKDYLVLELEVPVYRIHGFSFGESRPTYDNEDRETRARNRSVTALVMGPESDITVAAASPEE